MTLRLATWIIRNPSSGGAGALRAIQAHAEQVAAAREKLAESYLGVAEGSWDGDLDEQWSVLVYDAGTYEGEQPQPEPA